MDALESLALITAQLGNKINSFMESTNIADPMEPYLGPGGEIWEPLSGGGLGTSLQETSAPYVNLTGLDQIRRVCRYFARENPFAINGHENRISYIVGTGHTYTVDDRFIDSSNPDQKQKVQNYVDEFLRVNKWSQREPEIVYREDRDGETFLRFFEMEGDDQLRVRYVEPVDVRTPEGKENAFHYSFGIETEEEDFETVLNYYVGSETVPVDEIQHRKRGTSDCKRGTPIFWAVRNNLTRALKILRNGSTVTEIQTAIGMIKKYLKASSATVQAWAVQKHQDATKTSEVPTSSETMTHKYNPGAILNTSGNVEYEFPAMAIDPAKYVESLQAEIRAVAASIVMTEAMFSAKTDEASRASAEVAEGPVKRNFERLQAAEISANIEVLNKALDYGVRSGALTAEDVANTVVDATGPSLDVRNAKEEAETAEIKLRSGVVSIQTARVEAGYDDKDEQENIENHREREGGVPTGERPDDFLVDDEDGDADEDGDEDPEE